MQQRKWLLDILNIKYRAFMGNMTGNTLPHWTENSRLLTCDAAAAVGVGELVK